MIAFWLCKFEKQNVIVGFLFVADSLIFQDVWYFLKCVHALLEEFFLWILKI